MSDKNRQMSGYRVPEFPRTCQDWAALIDAVDGQVMAAHTASVLRVMATAADWSTGENSKLSVRSIAERAKIKESTCRIHIQKAISLGVLRRVRTTPGGYTSGGRGLTAAYRLDYSAILALPRHEYGPRLVEAKPSENRRVSTLKASESRRVYEPRLYVPLDEPLGPIVSNPPAAGGNQDHPQDQNHHQPDGGGFALGWNKETEAALLAKGVGRTGAKELARTASPDDVQRAWNWVLAQGDRIKIPAAMLVTALREKTYLAVDDPACMSNDEVVRLARSFWLALPSPNPKRTPDRERAIADGDSAFIRGDSWLMTQIGHQSKRERGKERRIG